MQKILIPEIIDCLKHLADEQFQRKAWLSKGTDPVSSFTEDVCQLFDDVAVSYFLEKGIIKKQLGKDVADAFIGLSKAIDQVDDTLSPQEILDLPEMKEVRRQAAVVLEAIHKAEELLDAPRKCN